MHDTHKRWNFWPFSGADGPTGGHVKGLGFMYGWTNQWAEGSTFSPTWSFNLFNLLYITHAPYNGTRWAVATLSLQFRRAQFRIGERERNRDRRRARKLYARR